MKIYRLSREQYVRRPIAEVFRFFEQPENLALITPPWLGFRILNTTPVLMKKGAVIDYSIRVMGVRLGWQSLISTYAPPGEFIDEQLRGPYAFWHHRHTFAESDGQTRISDEVQYALPLGYVGRMAHPLLVGRQLDRIFSYRSQVIEQIFNARD